MELRFSKSPCPCLDTVLQEVQNLEQTQELKLSEGMPDVGQVVSAWGQGILRTKEWRDGCITLTGGMMVWVLYSPEDGTQARCMESWIPFQMRWDLDEELPAGALRVCLASRFVDARSISARKIMVRCGIGAMVQALSPMKPELYLPESKPEEVELLQNTYPVRLVLEAGEKNFQIEEDVSLPSSAPEPEKLLYYRLVPKITDQKILGNRVLFRGVGTLHVLYASEEGQLFSWDFELPFSQYADLETGYSQDAQADVVLCATGVELELDGEGQLQVKCGLTGQYVVTECKLLELTEDAYAPGREMTLHTTQLELPAILDDRWEQIHGELSVPGEAAIVTDLQFLPDFPRQHRTEAGVKLQLSGLVQLLYYGEDGCLRSGNSRWEAQQDLPASSDCKIFPQPISAETELQPGGSTAKLALRLKIHAVGGSPMRQVTGGELGEKRKQDPQRPSLILQRVSGGGLWEIAKHCDSTREAIRRANALDTDPVPGQMLLIPITG